MYIELLFQLRWECLHPLTQELWLLQCYLTLCILYQLAQIFNMLLLPSLFIWANLVILLLFWAHVTCSNPMYVAILLVDRKYNSMSTICTHAQLWPISAPFHLFQISAWWCFIAIFTTNLLVVLYCLTGCTICNCWKFWENSSIKPRGYGNIATTVSSWSKYGNPWAYWKGNVLDLNP